MHETTRDRKDSRVIAAGASGLCFTIASRRHRTQIRVGRVEAKTKADSGTRTRDPQLGKLMLYQLSYARKAR